MQAAKDMEKVLDVPMSLMTEEYRFPPQYKLLSKQFFRRHGRDLFSCSATWLLLDVVFYSSNLFQSLIYHSYINGNGKKKMNAYDEAFQKAKLQAIVAICSTIPGYLVTVYVIDRIGRARIQLLGFISMSLVYFAIGIAYHFHWDDEGFMCLYGLTFFFANFGPNTTTFIVPAELFPARFRSTCHGISGAFGKVGAIVGSLVFLLASRDDHKDGNPNASGMTIALMILAGSCVLGAVVTYFFTLETMGRALEENEKD